MNIIPELDKKDVDVASLAKRVLEDMEVLPELLDGILASKDFIRFNSFKVLLFISEEHPEVLYPRWDFFSALLDSDNSYQQYIAIYLISSLTRADDSARLEGIFDKLYSILDGEGTITAAHLARNSGKIARAKPKLRARITERLLNIDRNHRGKQKELIKGHAIEAFDEYFEEAENQPEILEFVRKQLQSQSPKTRKLAREFLKKRDRA
ncbi:MAG: hypothetical protein P8X92_05760 [Dehalococcoidia bacterium]